MKTSPASRADLGPTFSAKHNAYETLRKLCSGWAGKTVV